MAGIGNSTRSVGVALAILGILLAGVRLADASAPDSPSDPAQDSRIINGKVTSISDWPWQVGLLYGGSGSAEPATSRYFCSGSLIAPDLVITAGHCVADLRPNEVKGLTVVAGRTFLNRSSTGELLPVSRAIMPLDSNGKRRYRSRGGAAAWDVALLKLASPSANPPIAIAGASETISWQPGRLVQTTGWGYTNAASPRISNRLRLARQVILPASVCRSDQGNVYETRTMICIGGPEGGSSTCSGDSGGPMVSPVGDGWRLVGLTSFGDFFCSGNVASVDNRTAGNTIRNWVREKAIAVSGYDPVGEGGQIGPLPRWCGVPGLKGRTRASARASLRAAGCSLGKVHADDRRGGRASRVVFSSLPKGWLAPLGFGIKVWLGS
ncbi:MAG: S1 family peptidase [Solirubrobacterales bacterium]